MSNAARRAIPGASDTGKGELYDFATDAFVLTDLATQAEMAAFALTGDLNGSTLSNPQIAAGAVGATELANGSVGVAKLSATGTPSSTTFHRGDNVWATPAGGGAAALDDLTDVVISSPSSGQVVSHNGTNWVNAAPSGGGTGLSLVNHATPTGSTKTLSLATPETVQRVQVDANLTLSVTGAVAGLNHFYLLLYHTTANSTTFTVTFWAGIEWVDDAAGPILPMSTAGAEALIEFWSFNGTSYRGVPRANFFP